MVPQSSVRYVKRYFGEVEIGRKGTIPTTGIVQYTLRDMCGHLHIKMEVSVVIADGSSCPVILDHAPPKPQ